MTEDFFERLQKCTYSLKQQKKCDAFCKVPRRLKCEHYFNYRGHDLCSSLVKLDDSIKTILVEHRIEQL